MLKRLLSVMTITVMSSLASFAWDLSNILGDNSKDILNGISNTVQNATATSDFSIDELTGTWNYVSPGVSFRTDNTAMKVTGAAAATTIENSLASYYSKFGINSMVLTVDADHNFTIKAKLATLKGTITKDKSGNLYFNFAAFGKISLGKVACMATKSGSLLNLTFDAKRMVEIAEKVAKLSKNSSFDTLVSLLSKYDGIYIGVKLKKH